MPAWAHEAGALDRRLLPSTVTVSTRCSVMRRRCSWDSGRQREEAAAPGDSPSASWTCCWDCVCDSCFSLFLFFFLP